MLSVSSSAQELLTLSGVINNWVGSGTLRFLTAGSGVYPMQTTANAQYIGALHGMEACKVNNHYMDGFCTQPMADGPA